MKIKGYEDFILEKVSEFLAQKYYQNIDKFDNIEPSNPELKNEKEYLLKMRAKLAHKIKGLSNFFDAWYSNLATSKHIPEEDFNDMQRTMDKTGFTLDIIKILFSKKVCQLTSEYYPYFIHKHHLDRINGYIDTYLYFLDDKLQISKNTVDFKVDLGGGHGDTLKETQDELDVDPDTDEWLIKYAYGYHKTPYGQLLLKQIGLTPEKFEKICKEKIIVNIWELFFTPENYPVTVAKVCVAAGAPHQPHRDFQNLKDQLHEIEEEERLINKTGDKYRISLEEFYEIFRKFLNQWESYDDFRNNFIQFLLSMGIKENDITDKDSVLDIIL